MIYNITKLNITNLLNQFVIVYFSDFAKNQRIGLSLEHIFVQKI